ncbi:MAG: hypothetical protein ACYC91_15810 [Solirubrobacteraceae bacterium]
MLSQTRVAPRLVLAGAACLILSIAFLAGRATVAGGPPPVVPGPNRLVDGVSVGFAHSEAGAEAAAAHYLLELERAMDTLDVQRIASVADLVATSREARAITAHAASVIGLERSNGAPLRRVAISTYPASYSSAAAEITVLENWIYATSSQEALWAIERVTLTWQNGDWRVRAIDGAASSANESLAELRTQLVFPGVGDASVR